MASESAGAGRATGKFRTPSGERVGKTTPQGKRIAKGRALLAKARKAGVKGPVARRAK